MEQRLDMIKRKRNIFSTFDVQNLNWTNIHTGQELSGNYWNLDFTLCFFLLSKNTNQITHENQNY